MSSNEQIFMWVGAGWYGARSIGDVTVFYHVAGDRAYVPDTYGMGLGAAEWFDAVPEWATAQ
jgi:hypothetical protein